MGTYIDSLTEQVPCGTVEEAISKYKYFYDYYEISLAQQGTVSTELGNIISLFGYYIHDGMLCDEYHIPVKYEKKEWDRMNRIINTIRPQTKINNALVMLLNKCTLYYGTDKRYYIECADDNANTYWKRVKH